MTEPRATYQVNEAIVGELLTLLSARQIAMLASLLRVVRKQGHGEIQLRINAGRLYISKKESFDGGEMPNMGG